MNKTELKLMRKLMFFSVADAAECISQTRARQWQRYESGDAPIPADVAEKITWFTEVYTSMFDAYEEEVNKQIDENGIAYIPLVPAELPSGDVPRLAVECIHQAVVAQLKVDYLQDLEIVENQS